MRDFKPHPYQETAQKYLLDNPSSALIMDMGLGKTITCLSTVEELFLNLETKGVLVVAPKLVATVTWPVEVESWNNTSWMQYQILHGRKKDEAFETPAHLYFVNYAGLFWLMEKMGSMKPEEWPFDSIIWDESSRMKSHKSKRFKLFKKFVRHFKRKILLTGTPSPQGLLDLWSQYYLLDCGQRLGTGFTHYRNRYFYPVDFQQRKWEPLEHSKKTIYEKVEDITLRISREDNLDLPGADIVDHFLKLPRDIRKTYDEFEKQMFAEIDDEGTEIEAQTASVLSGRCHQLAGGAIYVDEEKNWQIVHEEKINALRSIYDKSSGPLLVAYSFQHEKERILEEFPKAEFFNAKMDAQDIVKRWNAGKIKMLVAHPKSAGHGLNLQYGSHEMCWFTMTWSLEEYLQMNKRIDRQGQTKRCSIHRLIVEKTVEIALAAALERKEAGQQDFMNALKMYNKNRGLL
jgi:SNF2 family DNA or RNA helicase